MNGQDIRYHKIATNNGSLTKPEIVRLLWDVLPDQLNDSQKGNKIDKLLRKMRLEGKVKSIRNGGKSSWFLT